MPAQTKQNNTLDANQDRRQMSRPDSTQLDRRYGRIGIAAVAAALQFCTVARKPAAQKSTRIDDRFIELAA
jgi:hypothetical protein